MINICKYTLYYSILCLVGGIPTPLKNMIKSVGMMNFPIYAKIKAMFQTTNQVNISSWGLKTNKHNWGGIILLFKGTPLELRIELEKVQWAWAWKFRDGDPLKFLR